MKQEILKYYDDLAENYDENRFGNSYGLYVEYQERRILKQLISLQRRNKILDLGCGTGRLLDLATHGVDFSPKMIKQAEKKHPKKILKVGEIDQIPFPDSTFDCIFCMHVIMHQNKKVLLQFLEETHKKLNKKGRLIFDIISKNRRKKLSEQNCWHANHRLDISDIEELTKGKWILKEINGVMLFPIHRLSSSIKKIVLPLDIFLCKSFLKKWASYQIITLEKLG